MTAPWDEMSKTYPLITDKPSMQRVREILRSEMDDFGTAVDIGCGPGNQSIPLSEMFRRVYSVDLSPGMLARLNHECEERGIRNITTVESDWRDVKLPELCDLAFSSLCLASYEGLMKLEELSKGLCIYIGGTDDAVCTEKDILDELGLECIQHHRSGEFYDRLSETRTVRIETFSDPMPWSSPESPIRRCINISDRSPESERAIRSYFERNSISDMEFFRSVAIIYWKKL